MTAFSLPKTIHVYGVDLHYMEQGAGDACVREAPFRWTVYVSARDSHVADLSMILSRFSGAKNSATDTVPAMAPKNRLVCS
jgi:hypothetical protein